MTQSTQSPARQAKPAAVLCPYCGQPTPAASRCQHCRGLLDPLSRQATQNAMGPWFVRDPGNPFRPGCSYSTIKDMAARGRIKPDTILRGPTTHQFWSLARRTPGVSHLIGLCYSCQEEVETTDEICRFCGVSFEVHPDRQNLGLAPIHLLPGQAPPEEIAASSLDPAAATLGKVPGSEIPAIDDSAERLIRRLAGRIRSQRILVGLLTLLAFSAFALMGVVIAEQRLNGPRPVSGFLFGTPGPAATPTEPAPVIQALPAAPVMNPAPAPAPARAEPPAAPAQPRASQEVPQQTPSVNELLPARQLIEQGTEASLRAALADLERLARERPALASACADLEGAARQRLAQLRLRRLP